MLHDQVEIAWYKNFEGR